MKKHLLFIVITPMALMFSACNNDDKHSENPTIDRQLIKVDKVRQSFDKSLKAYIKAFDKGTLNNRQDLRFIKDAYEDLDEILDDLYSTLGDLEDTIDDVIDKNEDNDFNTSFRNSGSGNWDQILNEYERYVDKCIALIQKVNNGDHSVLSEYEDMLESAESLESLLDDADNMTASQASRYLLITNKLLSAEDNMSSSSWFDDDDDDDDWDF